MDKLRKSLDTIALAQFQGDCSIDTLIKACNNYKIQKGLVENYDYEIMVAKSCIDAINEVEQDKEITKAIVPGQTKVVDGVLYVYSATKVGSKIQYDWHVVRKGQKTQAEIGRGAKLSDQSIQGKQAYVNDLFPNDLSTLKVVKTLGGSTGAKLVEDADGNQYVLKKGSNTNSDHVKAEYLSNQLYGIMGLKTPDYELYDDNGEAVLLSRFIPGTHAPSSSDFANMSKGFIADVLIANWDVYQNDNCLIKNANGEVIRVDNGGCLDYRAQGSKKTFDGDVYSTWKSMQKYNPGIAMHLTDDGQLNQIKELLNKKDDVVNYLREIGEDSLAIIMGQRFDNLKKISDEISRQAAIKAQKAAAKLGKVLPRQLKSEDEMYAELDEDTIAELLDETESQTNCKVSSDSILTATDDQGWALLANICKQRGFDARPEVLSESDFWKQRKTTEWPLMMRGFDSVSFLEDFKFSDFCHFGQYGIWGQGIYAHSDDVSNKGSDTVKSKPLTDNNSNETNWKSSAAYRGSESATGYAHGNEDAVAKMFWKKGANIVNAEDLLDEIKAMGMSVVSNPQIKKLKAELDDLRKDWKKAELDLMNSSNIIKQAVFSKMHYDEEAVADLSDYLGTIDWGSRNAQGHRNYPMFDEAVLKHIKPCVEKCGGKVDLLNQGKEDEAVRIKIGHRELYIAKYSWNNNAVKQKNQFTAPYHYQAEKFTTFFNTNCVGPANAAAEKEIQNGKMTQELNTKVNNAKKLYYDKEDEYNKETQMAQLNPTDIYSRIYNAVKSLGYRDSGSRRSYLGIYAALKGYDGIYQPDGNSSGHGFTIILNRSKIVTSI